MAGTRFDCKEHSLFDGSGTAAGGAGGGPGVRGRRAVSVAPPRHSRRVACGLESAVQYIAWDKIMGRRVGIERLKSMNSNDHHEIPSGNQ